MFTVTIVGRPNVGKSTLFNKLSIQHKAIVQDLPGVTRDVQETKAKLGELEFTLYDTAGLDFLSKRDSLLSRTITYTEMAIAKSQVLLFVVDAKTGLTNEDKSYANWVRKQNVPVILVINKVDHKISQNNYPEFFKLGFENIATISAEHNYGFAELFEFLLPYQPNLEDIEEQEKNLPIKIAVVGRPNAGKSTLINNLIREDRLLTGPEPGITRDSIALEWQYKDRLIQLVDTAGIRKRNNIFEFLEKQSVHQSLRSIDLAHVVILLVDATIPLEKQDLSIANLAYDEGKPILLAVNKADLFKDPQNETKEIILRAQESLRYLGENKISFISALYNKKLHEVIDNCIALYERWQKKFPTTKLNQWLDYALNQHPLPLLEGGRRVRIKFINQLKSRPPTFQLFTNRPDKIDQSYLRYLTNSLAKNFDLEGVPIRFVMKKTDNPYENRRKKR